MNRSGYVLLLLALAAVGGGAYWLGRHQSSPPPVAAADKAERKPLFYRNPMNPDITSPVPAKDEMGMDYIPVYADEAQGKSPPGTVSIDPTIVQDIGVRTASAETRRLARKIHTVGRVAYDEDGLVRVNLRSDGWIERLLVSETGQPVRRGQPLLVLYSPQIVSTEQEYLLAARGVAGLAPDAPAEFAAQARALLDSSAERLRLLGVPQAEIERLRREGKVRREITLLSPAAGIVQSIGAREGQFVSAQTETFRIADLSRVWVLADVYADELPWVRVGDPASLSMHGQPGKVYQARVDFIYPYLEGSTRTQKVRLRLANPDLQLKPEMYADVTLDGGRQVEAVTVPESAVVHSGKRDLVFVVRAPGRFEPREVRTGVAADGYVQVLAGLQAGETVVTSGNFLIDSESRLREAAAKMTAPGDSQDPQ